MSAPVGKGRGPAGAGLAAGLALVALYALAIATGLASGPRHDYVAFLKIWRSIAEGGTAWPARPGRPSQNVYGPCFSMLGPLVNLHPLAPKWLFITAWFALALWLHALATRLGRVRGRWLLPALLLLHPYFWVEIPWFGHFDVLVAGCCLLGVDALNRGQEGRAGVWLALGGCLKLLPFALIPFLAIGRDRLRLRFAAAASLTTALAYATSWLVWGQGTFDSFRSGVTRSSKIMSIFRFLRGEHSPLRMVSDAPDADALATPLLGAVLLGLLWLQLSRRFETTGIALLALSVILALYPVGHPQLFLPLIVLVGYWWIRSPERFAPDQPLFVASILLCVWVTSVGALYPALDQLRGEWVGLREWLGLPTFVLTVGFALSVHRALRRDASA